MSALQKMAAAASKPTPIKMTATVESRVAMSPCLGRTANLMGGTAAGTGNIISGSQRDGVYVLGGTANVLQGNWIGTNGTDAQPLGNGGSGVLIVSGSETTIGGAVAHGGNAIAFNGKDGVHVNTGNDNAILHNAIFADGFLGIELAGGANHNQAAPHIVSASCGGGVTTIAGVMQSAPDTSYTLELFADTRCDPSGYGEGERFLAALTVTTDANGTANFGLAVALSFDPGEFIAATAADPHGNAPPFSACQQVAGEDVGPIMVTLLAARNGPGGGGTAPGAAARPEVETLPQPRLLPAGFANGFLPDPRVPHEALDTLLAATHAMTATAWNSLTELDPLVRYDAPRLTE